MKVNKKIIISTLLFLPFLCIDTYASGVDLNATITTYSQSVTDGSGYWQSSTIREWLNSEDNVVNYTSNRPNVNNNSVYAYDEEPGFLTNFTDTERDAIAITKRKVFMSKLLPYDGGSMPASVNDDGPATSPSLGGLISNWKDYYYQIVYDKVFYLNSAEFFYYVESRGLPKAKSLRSDAKAKFNYKEDYVAWQLTHQHIIEGYNRDTTYEINYEKNMLENITLDSPRGVVPALHIKPDYKFNGVSAKNLEIKSIVTFGSYNGIPIEWQVVNITDSGYALLLAKDAISLKHFNSKNNTVVYKYSKYMDYNNTYDVDISNDLQVRAMYNDDNELPTVTILNTDEFYERKIGSFTIQLAFEDNEGIDYIILPNKNKIYNSQTVSYTFYKNEKYYFDVYDVNGNYRKFRIPVSNINEPSKVVVTPSTTGWTNKDITVSIDTSNKLGSFMELYDLNTRAKYLPAWNYYNSYNGVRVRLSGSVELTSYTKDVGNITASAKISYDKMIFTNCGEITLRTDEITAHSWRLDYLRDNGKQDFDIIFTLPTNMYSRVQPFIQISIPENENAYNVRWTNLSYELVDTDGFGIEKIVLPTGEEVLADSYTDTLTANGKYTYTVYDNNGNVTKETVNAKIDKTAPKLNFTYDNSYTNSAIMVNVKSTDTQSGVNKIVDFKQTTHYTNELNYTIEENGDFVFKAYDKAGNSTTKTLSINNIDNEISDIAVTKTPTDWTNGNVTIKLVVKDNAGINHITLPSGDKIYSSVTTYSVSSNGIYSFLVFDNVGNSENVNVKVDNIDKTSPSTFLYKNPLNEWNNEDVEVSVEAID